MISQSEKKRFRAIGHRLKPVVTVAGNGLTPGVVAEIQRALDDHELIKVRLIADRTERADIVLAICTTTSALAIQAIGGIVLLYKAAPKPDPALSNLLRVNVL
jgi:RNA-binding protein